MSIIKIEAAAKIPSDQLEDWGTPKTVGEPVCQLRGLTVSENEDGSQSGIWECTPGKFIREVKQAEAVTFLSGHCFFHPDNGDTIEIKGGDVLFFPENSTGTWEIIETVRKAYLVYDIK